jgi:DNA-binding beta-propeller fold protein YncE
MIVRLSCGLTALLAGVAMAHAQIAVSANDGKAVPADAPDTPRTADTLSILKIGKTVRTLATLQAPATLVGPPGGVALTRDSRTAIVTAGVVAGADGAPVPGDVVTVIDISKPEAPRIVQTLQAGRGAAGIALNPAGTMALVANTGADSLSIFTVKAGRLEAAGTVQLPPRSRPVDVGFVDDSHAYVVAQGSNGLIPLRVDGGTVTPAVAIALGAQPYSLAIDRRTRTAYVSHLGGRQPATGPGPRAGSIGIVDLARGEMTGQVDTGVTPEHVGLSPSGRFLQVTVNNGSSAPVGSPAFHDFGLMTIYRADGKALTPVAEARTGRWCQGAAWNQDETQIFLQCSLAKQIEVYRFDGRSLTRTGTVALDARPGAIATARNR